MEIDIPLPLKAEHEELHAELALLTKSTGRIGAVARNLATVLHPHFVKEVSFALPPLGLLPAVASGNITAEMAAVTAMTDNLRAELPMMLQEHMRIAAAVRVLLDASQQTGDTAAQRFGEKLLAHARTEELVMYPAAMVLGD
ncbi:MAG: hemerythrin domain-containing protein [Gammaproteobacteria bacterium]